MSTLSYPAKHPGSRTKFRQPEGCALQRPGCSAIAKYEAEMARHKATEAKLRRSVNRERALLRQTNALMQQRETLCKESEHRFLNGLQLVSSLLTIQSRSTGNAEAVALLTTAADRVAAIGRVHRHLHTLDHVESVDFKQYLESLCGDLSGLIATSNLDNPISVTGVELRLPSAAAIPMAFIANELITNAIKYAKGRIAVRLQAIGDSGYSLSVSDDGPGLPEGFDPTASPGLGMKIISALVRQLGGSLTIGQGDDAKGTRFTVAVS